MVRGHFFHRAVRAAPRLLVREVLPWEELHGDVVRVAAVLVLPGRERAVRQQDERLANKFRHCVCRCGLNLQAAQVEVLSQVVDGHIQCLLRRFQRDGLPADVVEAPRGAGLGHELQDPRLQACLGEEQHAVLHGPRPGTPGLDHHVPRVVDGAVGVAAVVHEVEAALREVRARAPVRRVLPQAQVCELRGREGMPRCRRGPRAPGALRPERPGFGRLLGHLVGLPERPVAAEGLLRGSYELHLLRARPEVVPAHDDAAGRGRPGLPELHRLLLREHGQGVPLQHRAPLLVERQVQEARVVRHEEGRLGARLAQRRDGARGAQRGEVRAQRGDERALRVTQITA
mmetsp:Transcript_29601/g.83447  ORF Transcript_29601/g.83447 Transcript_29601/m.83447 type:complete len:344 (-) Transcript_29601:446-1477(-)